MGITKKLLSLACAVVMTASAFTGCSKSDKKEEGTTKKDFTISVSDIAEDMGAGWNLGNTLEANAGGIPNETAWGNPEASQEIIDMVADAGFKTIRVPVSYLSKINNADFALDTEWLDRIEEVVQYCYNRDLYVIINVHGDGYNSVQGGWLLVNGEDQETIRKKYEALWKQLAERFKDYDEHLIFESMNEVFDGDFNDPSAERYSNLNQYNQIFVDTVRATGGKNTHRYLLVPGWNTNINYTCEDYGFELPTDANCSAEENRLMVSVHYYDPWDYCGQEDMRCYLWGDKGQQIVEVNGANKRKIPDWGSQDFMEGQVQKLVDCFVSKDIPVIVGEYGAIDKSTGDSNIFAQINENRVYYNSYFAGTCAKNGVIPVYWDNGYNGVYGFGLFDRKGLTQTQPEIITGIVNAVKNKNPLEGADIAVGSGGEKQSEVHAYIGVQSNVYTFRNAWNDANYGASSEYFNTLIKWGEDQDGDGKDDIIDTGAVFEDATITQNGVYTVGVSGYDFSQEESMNMLFVSTDFAYAPNVGIQDVTIHCDDKEIPVENPVIMADSSGNMYIEIINIYNKDLAPVEMVMPKESLSISFEISGTNNVLG